MTNITEPRRQEDALAAANQRLAAHLHNSPLAVIEFDAQFRIARWTDGARRLFGWTAAEVLGRAIDELHWVHEDDRESVRQITVDMLGDTRPRNRNVNRNYRKDGSIVHCEWYNSVIYDAQGRLTSILSQVLDVSERKRAEEELARARRLAEERAAELETLLQAVPAAVWIAHDPEARTILGNRTASQWLRLPLGAQASLTAPEGARPTHFKVRQGGRELRGEEMPVQRAAGGTEVRDFDIEILFDDGTSRFLLGNATPLWDEQGRPRGSVAAFMDITERKAAEENLRKSKAQLRSFVRHAPIGIAMLDRDMNYLVTSGRWLAEHGRGHADLVGLNHYQVLSDMPPEWKRVHQQALSGATLKNDEDLWIQADGNPMWLRWAVQPWLDENGTIGGIVISFEDITEYKRTEEALRRQVELNRYYLDTVQTVIVALDGEGRITMINRKGCETLGYTEDELQGRNWFDTCLPPADGTDTLYPLFRRIMAGELEAVEYYENPIRCRDGQHRLIAWRNACLTDAAGTIVGTLSSGEDITERKRAEELLREADRRKDAFLATLAHELRNPLAPIRNAAEILRIKGLPDPTSRAARDMIERQLQHMVRLVDDLMDVSRITRGRLLLRRERLELGTVLEHAIEASRHHVQCAGHELNWGLPPQPIYLDADPLRLEQVFVNLLHNACKFTAAGGRIRVAAERDGTEFVVVKVTDTGIGIPPEHMPRMFEMFAQVGASPDQAQAGLGIGLSLSRGLVEMHGGSIEARSEGPGKGAELRVRLPILSETPEAPPPLSDAADDLKPAVAHRVLVVDDNPDVVESLALFLQVTGHEVETAHDGLEAVESAERYRPDLVLLDLGMPRLDGYAACRSIRGYPWGRNMVIVALTGWGQDDDRRKTEEAGFDGHLVKPVDPGTLQRLLADPRALRC